MAEIDRRSYARHTQNSESGECRLEIVEVEFDSGTQRSRSVQILEGYDDPDEALARCGLRPMGPWVASYDVSIKTGCKEAPVGICPRLASR